jgi:hypothetical protein
MVEGDTSGTQARVLKSYMVKDFLKNATPGEFIL